MLDERCSGVLLHPTSLHNRFPIGDLGPAAYAFIDFLAQSGQRWWQMLPVGPPGDGHSPYHAMSAFAGSPLLISPEMLFEQAWLNRGDIEPLGRSSGNINYRRVWRWKMQWLKKAYVRFQGARDKKPQTALEAFIRAESSWLNDFALFFAICEKAGTTDWTRWNPELRARQPAALARAKTDLAEELGLHTFIQWQFALQWQALKAYAARKKIDLIGDLPMFVALQSVDVWAHPELFKLNADGKPTVVAGVPPDYFSKTGQLWGNPIYRWDVLQQQNYAWWIERLRMSFRRFDGLRLDHFIGFVRSYEVPAGNRTAQNGQYRPGPGAHFFDVVEKALGSAPFIAEDLGSVTPEVEALRDQFRFPGMRVLQFEIHPGKDTEAFKPDHNPVHCVVYTGTHDNDTIVGWYRKLPTKQREWLAQKLGGREREIHWALIRVGEDSKAQTAVVPMQDLLGLGSEARMNVPGQPWGNWRWRLKSNALDRRLAQRLRQLTRICGRDGSLA